MENTINYKEENENLRLKIKLSKQKENEMKMEKELILLRKQNENLTDNIKPKPKVIKKQNEPRIDDNATNLTKLDEAKDEALERLFSFS